MGTHQLSIPENVPSTGVTVSRHTYDDGYYQKGLKENPRFVDNNDGTYSDRQTGLMWVRKVAGMITTAGIRTDNLAVPRGNWANSTSYAKGDLTRDATGGTFWICAVAHTSVAGAPDWAQTTFYSGAGGVFVKDANTGTYYVCNVSHTSLTDTYVDFQGGHSYTAGDIVHGSLTGGEYFQAAGTHTSVTQPTAYATSTFYNSGDYITENGSTNIYQANTGFTSWGGPGSWAAFTFYGGGEIVVDPDDGHTIYQANTSFTSNGTFQEDLDNGWWNQIGDTSDLFQVAFNYVEGANWNFVTSNLFTFEQIFNTWNDVGAYPFAVERNVNPSYWTVTSDTFSFSYERSTFPTYWIQTTYTTSAANLTSPFAQTFTSMLTTIHNLTYAGYSDWRIPNAAEYQTIMDWNANAVNSLLVAPTGFNFWTSTPFAAVPTVEQVAMNFPFSLINFTGVGNSSTITSLIVRQG